MSALAFIDNYQRIRQKFYTKKQKAAPIVRHAPKHQAQYVYLTPIGPIIPVRYNPKSISEGMLYAQEIIESGKIIQIPRNRGAVILREVSEEYGVSVEDILGARRDQRVVLPRQIIMYRLCKETGWSLPQIGRFLGNRDHTTVLNGRKKIERLIAAGKVTL